MPYPRITPPVSPWQGTRQIDDFGAGGFGAPRSRQSAGTTNGRRYTHKGLDCIGVPGDQVVFPFNGRLWPPAGLAYAATKRLGSVHILGSGKFEGLRGTLLYVKQTLPNDTQGGQGDPLGFLQDVAGYHEAKEAGKKMTNHCHFELYELVNGVWELRDPVQFLNIPGMGGSVPNVG